MGGRGRLGGAPACMLLQVTPPPCMPVGFFQLGLHCCQSFAVVCSLAAHAARAPRAQREQPTKKARCQRQDPTKKAELE